MMASNNRNENPVAPSALSALSVLDVTRAD